MMFQCYRCKQFVRSFKPASAVYEAIHCLKCDYRMSFSEEWMSRTISKQYMRKSKRGN